MELFLAFFFLLMTYFMTTLGVVEGCIQEGVKTVKEKNGKIHQTRKCAKILETGFILDSVFSGMYIFIYPGYQF